MRRQVLGKANLFGEQVDSPISKVLDLRSQQKSHVSYGQHPHALYVVRLSEQVVLISIKI